MCVCVCVCVCVYYYVLFKHPLVTEKSEKNLEYTYYTRKFKTHNFQQPIIYVRFHIYCNIIILNVFEIDLRIILF